MRALGLRDLGGGDFATLIRGENISPLGPTDGGGSGPVRFFLLGVADWPRGRRSQPCRAWW
jgi:hypothetical protein